MYNLVVPFKKYITIVSEKGNTYNKLDIEHENHKTSENDVGSP